MKRPAKMHVLLVDDEPIILATVGVALGQAGYDVASAGTGADAVTHLQEHRPDVLITDITMAGIDGIELMRQAKALDPDVTVIVITGYCDIGSAISALRRGAEDYLSKPFDFDELLLRVARCAETRDLRQKVRAYEDLLEVCPVCREVRAPSGAEAGDGGWRSLGRPAGPAGTSARHRSLCPACSAASERPLHRA